MNQPQHKNQTDFTPPTRSIHKGTGLVDNSHFSQFSDRKLIQPVENKINVVAKLINFLEAEQ